MTTPQDLRILLRALAGLTHQAQTLLYDSGYGQARRNETGIRGSNRHSTPCDQQLLATIVDTITPITAGWARNLSMDAQILIPTDVAEKGFWCAWMARHAEQLAAMPWVEDCVEELTDLAHRLAQQLTPLPEPGGIKLPDYATAGEIANAYNITPRAVRKYCAAHGITAWRMPDGTRYSTHQYRQARKD
ncbi:hypothetical protein CCICO_04355 [Corynebacterium ciconiae DSM 44920]|uniref:hypothetical protein n=2 Tax=Corynebacterium ciconiae TaxID=227319 RepID=UPI002647A88C|nr:hypothetical protein [Corynebacterium ciconiae]WKD60908.1 hypothetical protein CCICO_04355 [Corynebacterium ciconiae DSM 44920]